METRKEQNALESEAELLDRQVTVANAKLCDLDIYAPVWRQI